MSQESLSLSGLLPSSESFEFYDHDVSNLVDYMNGTNDQFIPAGESHDELLNDLEGIQNEQYTRPKQEIQEAPAEDQQLLPPPNAIPPVLSDEEYPGPLNFEVNLDPCGNKNPWIYSPIMRKIFIGINTVFPVDFKWTPTTGDRKLFIRATPTYSLPQHMQDLVLRCMPHALSTDASNADIPPHVWDHIIRCNNMQAMYMGDKTRGVHLSVVVPLSKPQTGCETVREMYKFMCKNSCASGMNRRPIQVLFTIEDENFEILGRRVLQVRVCSCPKRDKDKAEKEFQQEGIKSATVLVGKKRKNDTTTAVDLKEYRIGCKVIGKQNYIKVLEYAADLMRSEAYLHGPTAEANYKRVLTELTNQLKSVEQ